MEQCTRQSLTMETAIKIASYICDRYLKDFGERISEMKLHKLLYFSQRECFVQLNEPLFKEEFEAWKYGPVLVCIRKMYKDEMLHDMLSEASKEKYKQVFDKVFATYAPKDAWSLSYLTHGEYSWQKARVGVGRYDTCQSKLALSDIARDADRIRIRRFVLGKIQATSIHK